MGGHFWALLLVGASIAAVPFAVFGTAAGAFLVEAVKATRIRKKRLHEYNLCLSLLHRYNFVYLSSAVLFMG